MRKSAEHLKVIEAAAARFVKLAKEAEAHVKQYYPEGPTWAQFQMIYADAFAAEAALAALKRAA